jgi:2-polyprenyl-6-methoxyphenol hydroxylase-like FAD-dependent oxidoreductase
VALRVLIAGGGLGGLTLAHGLRQAGLEPRVFERGPPEPDLSNSYRIHLDATGSSALHACLPAPLWQQFEAHSAAPPLGLAFATEHLRQLAFVAEPRDVSAHQSHPISRAGLRQLLLTGLDDVVAFDKRVVGFEQASNAPVEVHFADGGSARGDVLVGADGSASAVRKQLLPHAQVVESGIAGIIGKVYLNQHVRAHVGPRILGQMTMVLPRRSGAMFLAPFQRGRTSSALDMPEHLFWAVMGRMGTLGLVPGAREHNADQLQHLARRMASGWHPLLQELIAAADPASLLTRPLHTAQGVDAWQPSRVTLLGDAIHTMTPLQGLGGNTALRDAALLRNHLVNADHSGDVVGAVRVYEAAMRSYGFAAVQSSLQVSNAIGSTNVPGRLAFRLVLRASGVLPPLHHALFPRPTTVD